MGHVPVPWYIGGDAIAPDKIARLVSFIAAGGREGVLNSLDCRVLALATPGPAIRVMPGAYAINSRTHPNENYTGMVDEQDVVGTTATGSSGGRSDLVVVLVQNSNDVAEGWDEPADPENGPYISTVIFTGVPAGTTSFGQLGILGSGIALARIDFPPSTATVTQSMIKDLRGGSSEALPGTSPVGTPPAAAAQTYCRFLQGSGAADTRLYSAGSFGTWPASSSVSVPVPAWATACDYEVVVVNAVLQRSNSSNPGHVLGEARINLGSILSSTTVYDINDIGGPSNPCTVSIPCGGTLTIPASLRGQTAAFKMETRALSPSDNSHTGNLVFQAGSYLKIWLHFKSNPLIYTD